MTLKTFLKINNATRLTAIIDTGCDYVTYKIDYLDLDVKSKKELETWGKAKVKSIDVANNDMIVIAEA